jgi:hypothetical protein
MLLVLWTLQKSHTTFNIITQDTAANNADLITRNMPEDDFWNFFSWEPPLIKTNQPMLQWMVCIKGSIELTTAAEDHHSNEEEKNPFCITTPPSKWTPEDVADLSMLGTAEDQGGKIRGRLPSPMILFAQDRGMGGIEEQRKEDSFAVNDKCPGGKARPPRTSPGPVNPPKKRDTISKDRDMPHSLSSVQLPENKGLEGQEEQRKAPFDISGITNCPSKSLASIILTSKHTLDSQSLFAEEESGDDSNMTSSKDGEDDSLNGGERSRVIKETITETFVERPSKGENAASRNLDDREVEDDWDGTYLHNGDYVEGRINETFVARPSMGEQAPSRNSNQSINRQENDEVSFNPRKVDEHHIDIYTSDLFLNTTSTKSHISEEESFFSPICKSLLMIRK